MLLWGFAAIVLFMLGFLILLHHGYKHMDDAPDSNAKREGIPWLCLFQLHDISNHETWIVVCWTNALTITILMNVYASYN